MKPPYEQIGLNGGRSSDCEASPPSAYTPSSNRGVGLSPDLEVSVHWLAITIHDSLSNAIGPYLSSFFDIPDLSWSEASETWFRPMERTNRGYAAGYECRDGMEIFAYPSTGNHCHLVMRGSVLEKYSISRLTSFLLHFVDEEEVEEFLLGGIRPKANVTRIDLAIDNCPFSPRQVFDAQDSKNFRSKARPGGWFPDNGTGATAYHGSKKSDKQLRVYDRRGPTRLEIQYRNKAALALCASLCYLDEDDWVPHAIGIVRDFIDFVDRQKNISESPLLDWWEDFVGSSGRIRLPSGYVEPDSIAGLRGFVERVAPSIKALLYYEKRTPDEFFERVRLRERQINLLRSVGRWGLEEDQADVS